MNGLDKKELIKLFNNLGIEDMEEVTELYELKGSFINLEYTLASGQKVRLWDDEKTYLGVQIERDEGDRCYGLTTDGKHLLVCEYGCGGADPEIVIYKRIG